MQKKDKFYILIFIFSILSICASIALKLFGFDWFCLNKFAIYLPEYIDIIINFVILSIQYFLIVGCVTRYNPKILFFKMLPYMPLLVLMEYFPKNVYSILTIIILLVPCLSFIPKFSTVFRFIYNIIFVSILQLIIIWLRVDIKQFAPIFPETIQFLAINIDQLIILSFLYYINRRRGDNNGIHIFRQKD